MLGIMKKAVPSNREDSTAFVVKSQPNFIAEQREVYHNIRPSDRVCDLNLPQIYLNGL